MRMHPYKKVQEKGAIVINLGDAPVPYRCDVSTKAPEWNVGAVHGARGRCTEEKHSNGKHSLFSRLLLCLCSVSVSLIFLLTASLASICFLPGCGDG